MKKFSSLVVQNSGFTAGGLQRIMCPPILALALP